LAKVFILPTFKPLCHPLRKNIDHLGLVAGIIDEIGIVEIINEQVSIERGEIVTAGQVVKAIILNGLGFVSRALYLFPQFFEDKATEHLLGEGIEPKQLRLFVTLYAKSTYKMPRQHTSNPKIPKVSKAIGSPFY
jgi:transposase